VSGRPRYDVVFYLPEGATLLAKDAGPSAGGAETQIVLLCRALANRGLAVCLVVFDIPGARIPSSIDGFDVVVRPPYVGGRGFLARLREVTRIHACLRKVDTPLYATRMAGPHVGLVGLSARLARRRFIYSAASLGDFQYEPILPRGRDRVLFRLGIALADEIVVQTKEQVPLCERRFGRTPILIRSLAESGPRVGKDARAFIWIGRFEANKRPLEFVQLARSIPEARFWMVGAPSLRTREDADLWEQIDRTATSLPNLELISPLPRPELMERIAKAVAVVSTSEIEGMPNTFLEGWAQGVPALALSHDPDGIIARHGLGAFAEGQHERLVGLARELWENRAKQREIGARCRAYARTHHSTEAIGAEWARIVRPTEKKAKRSALVTLELSDPDPDVLVITNLWPRGDDPAYGIFIKRQVDSLRDLGVRVDVLFVRGYISRWAYLVAAASLFRLSRAGRPPYRLVHAHGGETIFSALAYRRASVLLSYLGSDVLGAPKADGSFPISARIRRTLLRRSAGLVSHTITKSREMHLLLPRSLRRRNAVVPNGVDDFLFVPIPRDEARRRLGWDLDAGVALFGGNPRVPTKRFWLAEAAFAAAKARLPGLRLETLSGVEPSRVPLLMSAADCLVLPSVTEGSPNVVKEALMCNLPVIATPAGDVRDLLRDVAPSWVCEPTPEALADALVECLSEPRRSDGRSKSLHLSARSIALQVLSIYERVLPQSPLAALEAEKEVAAEAPPQLVKGGFGGEAV
jgi:teichuronic acid biosynthesis glycosyltransferase TuaC